MRLGVIGRWVPERSLKRANQSVRRPDAAAASCLQRRTRGLLESAPLGRGERGTQFGNKLFGIEVRCCKQDSLHVMVMAVSLLFGTGLNALAVPPEPTAGVFI